MKLPDRNITLSYIALSVVVIGMAVWRMFIAPISDDFAYAHVVLPTSDDDFWNLHGPRISSWKDVLLSAGRHWLLVSGRLSSMAAFGIRLLPVWLSGALSGLVAGATIWLLAYCAGGRRIIHTSWIIALLALISWKWLPWYNDMVADSFYLCYGWSGVAAMVYAAIYLNPRPMRTPYVFLACLLALIAGWMHEGYGIPLCAASLAVLVSSGDARKRRGILLLFLTVGTALVTFSPQTLVREGTVADVPSLRIYALSFVRLLGLFYPIYIYLLTLAAIWWRRGLPEVVRQIRINIFWLIVTLTSLAIAIAANDAGRLLWLPGLAMLIVILRALCDNFNIWRRPLTVVAVLLICANITFISATVYWQRRISEGQWEIMSQVSASGHPYAFVDVVQRDDLPWWTLMIPRSYTAMDLRYLAHTCIPVGSYEDFTVLVLPERFRDVPFDSLPRLSSDGLFRGVWPVVASRDSFPAGTVMTLAVDGEYPSMSPPAKLLRRLLDRNAPTIEANVYRTLPSITQEGDTVWIHVIDPGRLGAYLRFKGVELKR